MFVIGFCLPSFTEKFVAKWATKTHIKRKLSIRLIIVFNQEGFKLRPTMPKIPG